MFMSQSNKFMMIFKWTNMVLKMVYCLLRIDKIHSILRSYSVALTINLHGNYFGGIYTHS